MMSLVAVVVCVGGRVGVIIYATICNCKNELLLIREEKTLLLPLAAGQLKVIRAHLAEILLMK